MYEAARSLALAIASATILAGHAMAADEVRIGGTGAALGTLRLLGETYSKRHPGEKITVLPSLGSGGAMKAVAKEAVDIGVSSRALKQEERALGLVALEYARTPFVFAVPVKSQVTTITSAQAADMYAGRMLNWPDGGRVRVVMRPAGDSDNDQMKEMSAAMSAALQHAERVPGAPFTMTDQETATELERIPGAFGSATLALIRSENRSLRALDLDGVAATVKNAAEGRYPHYKRLYLVTRQKTSAAGERFIAFVRSPEGAAILKRNEHWIP